MQLRYRQKFALTIEECVASGPVGRSSLYKAMGEGRLRFMKNGRRTYVLLEDWLAFLRQEPIAAAIGERGADLSAAEHHKRLLDGHVGVEKNSFKNAGSKSGQGGSK